MIALIAASLLVYSANALLFPLNNAKEPEPELLFACPPPSAPQFGSIKCDYGLFDLKCTAQCDSGFQFENAMTTASVECDLFEGKKSPDVPKCVRIGGTVNPGTVTTTNGCVRTLDDCFNKLPKDYQYCDDCRMFASCAASGLYVRRCPGIGVFDAAIDRCVDHSNTCTMK